MLRRPGDRNRRDLSFKGWSSRSKWRSLRQADFRDCAAGPVDDPSVAGKTRRVAGGRPIGRTRSFPLCRRRSDALGARSSQYPFPTTITSGFRPWSIRGETLGFVVETTPAGAPRGSSTKSNRCCAAGGPLVAAADRTETGQVVVAGRALATTAGGGRVIDYDVAVAGAGLPAGVFALLAARAGYRVLLAERSSFEVPALRWDEALRVARGV